MEKIPRRHFLKLTVLELVGLAGCSPLATAITRAIGSTQTAEPTAAATIATEPSKVPSPTAVQATEALQPTNTRVIEVGEPDPARPAVVEGLLEPKNVEAAILKRDFESKNPGCVLLTPIGQSEQKITEFLDPKALPGKAYCGGMVDEVVMSKIFNISALKDGRKVGSFGTREIKQIDAGTYIDVNTGEVCITFSNKGFPVVFMDKSGQLMKGFTDGSYKLEPSSVCSAFEDPSKLVERWGYRSEVGKVISVGLEKLGNSDLFTGRFKIYGEGGILNMKFVGPKNSELIKEPGWAEAMKIGYHKPLLEATYISIKDELYYVNDRDKKDPKKALVGIMKDGKRSLLGLEVDGKMRQAAEWVDEKTKTQFVVVDNSPEKNGFAQHVSFNEKSGEVFFGRLLGSLAEQKGVTKEVLLKQIADNNGMCEFRVPERFIDLAESDAWVDWETKIKVDLKKPIEIRMSATPGVASNEELVGVFPKELSDKVCPIYVSGKAGSKALVWSATDSHMCLGMWISTGDGQLPFSDKNWDKNSELYKYQDYLINRLTPVLAIVRSLGWCYRQPGWDQLYKSYTFSTSSDVCKETTSMFDIGKIGR